MALVKQDIRDKAEVEAKFEGEVVEME